MKFREEPRTGEGSGVHHDRAVNHQPRADRSSGSSPRRRGTFEMKNRTMLRLQWMLPILVIAAGLIMPSAASAQTACSPTINSCGCTIIKPGSYKIGLAINSTQGLTSNNACIEIASSFVILDGGKKTITGPGGTTPTGIGILLHRNFRSNFLEGRGTVISGWDIGLLIQGSQIVADDFTANSNGTAG